VSKRGLPPEVRMRHDAHYVEELSEPRPTPIGRLISIDQIDPNPEQPRVEIGNLTELTASIRDNGVLEPLLVKPSISNGRWMIIAGERRWRAAAAAGLREVPCIEMEVDDRAVAEIALIENMQRKDLTTWEESDGLAALCQRFGYTHEEVARKVGKSRSTVTEALSIAALPSDVREKCQRADIQAKSLLLQIVRQPDEEAMRALIEVVAEGSLTRDEVRAVRKGRTPSESGRLNRGSDKPHIFRFQSPNHDFNVELRFFKSAASNEDVIEALRIVIGNLNDAKP